ncbi:MAG: hypothetical protein FWG73_07210 [Planctomycetaceae bacterium]|nr:hypothetical protein [Planctomycetaceae bacterium]
MHSSLDLSILLRNQVISPPLLKTAARASPSTQVNNSSGQWFSPDSTSGQIFDNVIWDRNASTGSNLMGWGATLGSALIPGGAVARGLWLAARHGRKAYQVAQAANKARQAAQVAKAAVPMTTAARAGQVGTTAAKGTANAVLGYQAGLASGAAAGTAADAVGLGGNKTNTIGEPTYGERATNMSAMAYAPLLRMGGSLGSFTNPVLGAPAKGTRTWGRFAGDAGAYGAGMLGAERATDAVSSGLSALQPDKAHKAITQFAQDQGIDTSDKGSMQALRNQIDASGIVKRNLMGQFSGLRNHTDAMGSPVNEIDFAGMKTPSGGKFTGSDRIDLTDALGRNMGIQTPRQRTFQDQFNRLPLAEQSAIKEYYDPGT